MNSPLMGQQAMSAVNQSWPHAGGLFNTAMANGVSAVDLAESTSSRHTTFNVEKVDNGFILRCGKYTKVCSTMDELRDLFVAVMVEKTMDK